MLGDDSGPPTARIDERHRLVADDAKDVGR